MSYHVTAEQAASANRYSEKISVFLAAAEKAEKIRKELFAQRTPEQVNKRIKGDSAVKRKNIYDPTWKKALAAEAMKIKKDTEALSKLARDNGITRPTLIRYMSEFCGFVAYGNGQKQRVFSPDEIELALRMRAEGKTFREIGTVLKASPSCARDRIPFNEPYVPRTSHR